MDFPEDGWPRISTCFAGIDLDRDTESKIEDQRSWGGNSGVDERDIASSPLVAVLRGRSGCCRR